jgi:hypothetical protein
MKAELFIDASYLVIAIVIFASIIGLSIYLIIQHAKTYTKTLMITLANTIFEDIHNPLFTKLEYVLPFIRKDYESYEYHILKSLLSESTYCNPYYCKNGYALIVCHKGEDIKVSVQRWDRNNEVIYSRVGKLQ